MIHDLVDVGWGGEGDDAITRQLTKADRLTFYFVVHRATLATCFSGRTFGTGPSSLTIPLCHSRLLLDLGVSSSRTTIAASVPD
jgi:hypothetical protein